MKKALTLILIAASYVAISQPSAEDKYTKLRQIDKNHIQLTNKQSCPVWFKVKRTNSFEYDSVTRILPAVDSLVITTIFCGELRVQPYVVCTALNEYCVVGLNTCETLGNRPTMKARKETDGYYVELNFFGAPDEGLTYFCEFETSAGKIRKAFPLINRIGNTYFFKFKL